MSIFYKLMLLAVLCVVVLDIAGCSLIAPNRSKAITEERQYDEMKLQTEEMRKQREIMERIAVALDKIAEKE